VREKKVLPVAAVAGGDDIFVRDEGPATHQGAPDAAAQQGDLVGKLAISGVGAADNAAATPAQVSLMRGLQQLVHPRGACA
jgi:hypothetical protein